MRIASRCLPRQRVHLSKPFRRAQLRLQPTPGQQKAQPISRFYDAQNGTRFFSNTSKTCARKRNKERNSETSPSGQPIPDGGRSIQPAELVAKLDKYLPSTIPGVFPRSATLDGDSRTPELTLRIVDLIHSRAKEQLNIDLFEWMVENGYEKAAIWIISEVLRKIAATTSVVSHKLPSNIVWPSLSRLLSRDGSDAIEVTQVKQQDFRSVGFESSSGSAGRPARVLLNVIWTTLGRLVLKAANLDTSHSARLASAQYMSATFLILGRMHSLGFMPDDIYAYNPSLWSTFVQRPPILHLISSRILASISDATWRDSLSDAVAQATARGISLEKLTEVIAGSRFNVRVRDMGPEVWLELILWCCVETGQRSAAVSIIRALRECQDNPWFAVGWNPSLSSSSQSHSASIDWAKVKLRTGGTVGSIEGYSLEKPFIDVPPRTISVEVVLAIVELCLNTCSGSLAHGTNSKIIEAVQLDIADTIAFLEPHDLPPEYLDYVGSRLAFAGDLESTKSPVSLKKWADYLQRMQKLETIRKREVAVPDLSLKAILSHSQFLSSVQQQALDKLIQSGDVHSSLQLFNDIQETIDQNKVNSITEFLQTQQPSKKDFFSARPFPDRLEYVNSYGQLPHHRLASFLNLLSDNNMTGMGQWLLYADEVDGPVIPSSAYRQSSMLAAILKFSVVSGDDQLRHSVLDAGSTTKRLPTVRFLRQLVDACVSVQDFRGLREVLKLLKSSQAGGAGIENIVYFASTLLRLESNLTGAADRQDYNVRVLTDILEEILRGEWDTTHGTFGTHVRRKFLQHTAFVLKMFANTGSRTLGNLARSYVTRFPSSNVNTLPPKYFNMLLSAIVDVHGSSMGRNMWMLFCGDVDVSDLDDASEAGLIEPPSDIDSNELQSNMSRYASEALEVPFSTSSTTPRAAGDVPGTTMGNSSVSQELGQFQSRLGGSSTNAEVDFNDPFFPVQDSSNNLEYLLQPTVITRPNMQTIRIIVEAALKEQGQLRDVGLGSPKQDATLAWAYWMFKSISSSDDKAIEQELQQSVKSLSEEIEQYLEDAVKKPAMRSLPTSRSVDDVSPLWKGATSSQGGDIHHGIKRLSLGSER